MSVIAVCLLFAVQYNIYRGHMALEMKCLTNTLILVIPPVRYLRLTLPFLRSVNLRFSLFGSLLSKLSFSHPALEHCFSSKNKYFYKWNLLNFEDGVTCLELFACFGSIHCFLSPTVIIQRSWSHASISHSSLIFTTLVLLEQNITDVKRDKS
jgi:hypothetical protein